MIKVNENKRVNARDVYNYIGVGVRFNDWIKRYFEYIDAKEGKDFYSILSKKERGRPSVEYEITLDCAKEICMIQPNSKSKELRLWLINISNQKENLELITVKEAAFAVKVINCLKYVENQKEAYNMHQTKYVAENIDITNPKYIYSEFAKYRASITGWDKNKVDQAIETYLHEHSGYNRSKVAKANMQTKLSVMDIGEAIRVACLDILYSKDADKDLAGKFSILCKNLAKEMGVTPEKANEDNLFRQKEALQGVRSLELKESNNLT